MTGTEREERVAALEAEREDLRALARGLSHNDIEEKTQWRLIDIAEELRQLRGGRHE